MSLPTAAGPALEQALKTLSPSGLSVRVTPTSNGVPADDANNITLSLIGPDRPGIVREISQAMASHEVNVIEMASAVISAPMSCDMLFQAHIEAQISPQTSLDQLSDMLDEIANEMTLDISLDAD